MKKLFIPDMYVSSIYLIDIEILKENEIHGIIIDIDNTLVPWKENHVDGETINFIENLLEKGFRICILSNNTKKRVDEFNKRLDLNLPAIHRAIKPGKAAYKKAMKVLNTNARQTAVIGDQILTDIFGGNRLDLFTILIDPISPREFYGTRLVRKIENLILKGIKVKYENTKLA